MDEEPATQRFAFGQTKVQWLLWLYGVPLAGFLHVFGSIVAEFADVPRGSVIRPMGLTCWIAVAGIATGVAGVVLGLIALITGRKVPVLVLSGLLCIGLCQLPWAFGPSFFRWYAGYRGLILSD